MNNQRARTVGRAKVYYPGKDEPETYAEMLEAARQNRGRQGTPRYSIPDTDYNHRIEGYWHYYPQSDLRVFHRT